jgi:hypothetical protein
MDTRVKLLKEFYNSMQRGKLKLEIDRYGFDFLDEILSDGITIEYGQLTAFGLTHKYKLLNVPDNRLDNLLKWHINKECNICLYFDEIANNTFCFNLDNNYKSNNTQLIPEMKLAVNAIIKNIEEFGIEPLVIASGRGYHVWCRLGATIDNKLISDFMIRTAAKSMWALHENGFDHNKVKCNMYPNCKNNDILSLRLFGTNHIKNKVFSYICTESGPLDEDNSWDFFADYITNKTIPKDQFMQASDKLRVLFGESNAEGRP